MVQDSKLAAPLEVNRFWVPAGAATGATPALKWTGNRRKLGSWMQGLTGIDLFMWKNRKIHIVSAVIALAVAWYYWQGVGGGNKMLDEVMAATKTNAGAVGYFGDIGGMKRYGLRDWVDMDLAGSRKGSFSFWVKGSRNSGNLRVLWTKIATNDVVITSVWRGTGFDTDNLLWPVPGHQQ